MEVSGNTKSRGHTENKIDTLKVEVVEALTERDGQTYYFFEYEYPDLVDTEYVHIEGDTLYISWSHSPYNESLFNSIEFPIQVLNGWSTVEFNDTSTVRSIEYVETPVSNFYHAYRIETQLWCGDECGHRENAWYVPNIGLVKKHIYQSEWVGNDTIGAEVILRDETWRLFRFGIPE